MKKVITASNYEVIPLNLRTNVRFYTSVDFGSYVPPHRHDAIEILYLQEGELKVNTESTSRNLRSGQCTLIQPNKVHSTLCTRPNKAIVFQIPLLFLEKFVPDASRLTFQLEGTPRQASQPEWDRQKTQINQFKEKLTQMQFIMDTKPDGAPLMFNTLLFDVLYQLYHNFSFGFTADSTSRQNQNLEKLKPVLDYINCNYNRAISLTEISRIAMFDPKYLCRFFKKCMGTTFLEYQNDIRISHIYQDLVSTNDKIFVILERHGFTNYKLFRKVFYEHFGATPTEVRKNNSVYQKTTL